MSDPITYEVKDRAVLITLNNQKLNSLTIPQYDILCKFLERANNEEGTIITLIQSTGRVFSAGANADFVTSQDTELDTWLNLSVAKQTFWCKRFLPTKDPCSRFEWTCYRIISILCGTL